ncbi:MAG: hypothetical protein HY096_09420 [Nitrospinae bacterium]|nr:hypothetical protein [Nitrospinota bacterium]
MNTLKYKNRAAILSFVFFSLISLALLPFYHIHTDIEHISFLESHKHKAHQHICLIEQFISGLTGGYIDKDCEDSHEEEDAQTNKSQYLIKHGEELKKDLSLSHEFVFKIQNLKSEGQNSSYFLQINFIHSDYNFSPFCNNFSNRSPPQILI